MAYNSNKTDCRTQPSTVNILEGPRSYEFQIWWEVSPWVTDVYPVYARVAAKSSEEEDDGEARAGRRMGVGRPGFNKGRQQVMAGGTDAVGQPGLLEAERVRMGAEHLWRSRGNKKEGIGPDIRPVQATSGEGVAMRHVNDSVEGAGGRNGLNGPLSYGLKLGPVNWAQSQKAMMGGRKLKKKMKLASRVSTLMRLALWAVGLLRVGQAQKPKNNLRGARGDLIGIQKQNC